MKLLYVLIFLISLVEAKTSKVQIVADKFKANDNKKVTIFTGNVVVTKEKDKITSNILTVKFDKNNKPISYEAIKNVKFKIYLKESFYDGSCEYLKYDPNTKIYTLKENVKITEYPSKRILSASKAIIDATNEKTEIFGNKNKPVKFIFDIEEE